MTSSCTYDVPKYRSTSWFVQNCEKNVEIHSNKIRKRRLAYIFSIHISMNLLICQQFVQIQLFWCIQKIMMVMNLFYQFENDLLKTISIKVNGILTMKLK